MDKVFSTVGIPKEVSSRVLRLHRFPPSENHTLLAPSQRWSWKVHEDCEKSCYNCDIKRQAVEGGAAQSTKELQRYSSPLHKPALNWLALLTTSVDQATYLWVTFKWCRAPLHGPLQKGKDENLRQRINASQSELSVGDVVLIRQKKTGKLVTPFNPSHTKSKQWKAQWSLSSDTGILSKGTSHTLSFWNTAQKSPADEEDD